MCGIAGLFNYHSNLEQSSELNVKKMLATIRHRGPDETGIYLSDNIALGSVRLSIIDLSSGQQPLCDESGRYWIVYNGEIFNYRELRRDLENKGVHFKTQSDTEVVIEMYAMYGSNCLQYFNGQFAFCIYDSLQKKCFLARDRVGIRPLFYWYNNNSFVFCSEIKGIFSLDKVSRSIDTRSLAQVFTFWTTLTPNTSFQNIYELPPGNFMVVDTDSLRITKFWSLDFSANTKISNSISSVLDEFSDLLTDAVRIRLRSDVPIGAYLSGGLDSSITTSIIKELNPGILNTFSIGFKDKIFDETSYQLEASKYFNTNHTAFECSAAEIAEHFIDTVWHSEFPILRTAPTPMFMLSKKVRQANIKVVITGEGADEMLAGYNIFKEAKIRKFWSNQPDSKFRSKLLSKLYPYLPMMKDTNNVALKMFFGYKLTDVNNPLYSHLLRWHNTSRIKSFFSTDILNDINDYDPLTQIIPDLPVSFKDWSDLAKSQYLEATIFMSGYLLSSQGDRMAMGNSVEGRYPFLDYRVIEFCNKLPDSFKLNCLNEKFLLKKMSIGKIPESITKRTKQPYRAPIANSFFNKNAPDFVADMLSERNIKSYGLFDYSKVSSLIKKVDVSKDMPEVDQMAIAGILSTQLLYKMFIADSINPDTSNLKNLQVIRE